MLICVTKLGRLNVLPVGRLQDPCLTAPQPS